LVAGGLAETLKEIRTVTAAISGACAEQKRGLD
jgi:hypothetical protein